MVCPSLTTNKTKMTIRQKIASLIFKIKQSNIKTHITYLLIIFNICIWAVSYTMAINWHKEYIKLVEQTLTIKIEPIEAKQELTMREWVLNEIKRAGLNPVEADCIITNESGWENWKHNTNSNGTIDTGLWQINSIHKNTISLQNRYDYKKGTAWAINKRLAEGNWNAWVGYKNCK